MLFKRIINKYFKTENRNYEDNFKKYELCNSLKTDISLLVITDTHGFLTDESFSSINNDFDLCCVLGDISDNDYKLILKYIPKEKIVALLGNHDRFSLLDEYGIKNINGDIIEINGIKIGGIQGSYKYKNESFPSFTHEESIDFLNRVDPVDILLSHDKPFIGSVSNSHNGLKGITNYLYKNKVPYNIHGHIHENKNYELKNGTKVISVYGLKVINLKE